MAGKGPLLALTLTRPWPHFVAYGSKRVENRDWEPPDDVIGRYIAIHAGMKYDLDDAASIEANREELGVTKVPSDAECPKGVICAVVKVVGALELRDGVLRTKLGPLTPGEVKAALESPWATRDGWAWCLSEVVALPEPLPCRGNRKLWLVPSAIADEVRRRWAAAKGLRYAG